MKKITLLAVLAISLIGCNGGGSGGGSTSGGGGGNNPPVTIPNCTGLPLNVSSFVTGYDGNAKVVKDNTTVTYPTGVEISSYDPALYYTYNRYIFGASLQMLNQAQDLIVVVNGNTMPPIHNAVMVTSFNSSNPTAANGESITMNIGYTINSVVTNPVMPGNYTATFTCKANYQQ